MAADACSGITERSCDLNNSIETSVFGSPDVAAAISRCHQGQLNRVENGNFIAPAQRRARINIDGRIVATVVGDVNWATFDDVCRLEGVQMRRWVLPVPDQNKRDRCGAKDRERADGVTHNL